MIQLEDFRFAKMRFDEIRELTIHHCIVVHTVVDIFESGHFDNLITGTSLKSVACICFLTKNPFQFLFQTLKPTNR